MGMAYINEEGRRTYLGRFRTLEEASEAPRKEADKRGFAKRHGT